MHVKRIRDNDHVTLNLRQVNEVCQLSFKLFEFWSHACKFSQLTLLPQIAVVSLKVTRIFNSGSWRQNEAAPNLNKLDVTHILHFTVRGAAVREALPYT